MRNIDLKNMNSTRVFFDALCLFLILTNVKGKQNILLIISDDLRTTLGCYGDKIAYTPNVDELCKESVIFFNSYAQQALCAPSRNSFLTSRRPDTLRLYDFYSYWRDFIGNFTTLPQYFKEHGYYTKSIGKVFHPGKSSNFTDDQPYSWSCDPFHPSTEAYKDAPVCGQGVNLQSNLVCPVVPRFQPQGTLPDLESFQEAKSFIQNWGRTAGKLPFFLAVGFHKPHIPLKYPQNFIDYYPIHKMKIPPNSWQPLDLPHVSWNHWQDVKRRDDIASLNISFPFGRIPDDWSKLIRQSYYAAVSYIDDLVGKLLKELKKAQLYSETIVIFMSDHGWSLGEHGEWSKFSNYEAAVKVPLIIRIPGLTDKENVLRSTKDPVELLDVFPTLVDAAGLPSLRQCPGDSSKTPLCTQGASLMPIIYSMIEQNKTINNYIKKALSQYPRPGIYPSLHPDSDKPLLHEIKYMGYSLRTAQYRYTEWPEWRPWDPQWEHLAGVELYDHSIDFAEDINLATRPQFQNIRKKLSTLLRKTVSPFNTN